MSTSSEETLDEITSSSEIDFDSEEDYVPEEDKAKTEEFRTGGTKRCQDEGTVGDTDGTVARSEKKARKHDGSAGDAKYLLGLPFDHFVEILSHFEGPDLVSLAQVNKAFHQILISKDVEFIWRRCRQKDGLPLLPGMSELEFALLLHGTRCQTCGAPARKDGTSYLLRHRYCEQCARESLITDHALPKEIPMLHHHTYFCAPSEGHEFADRQRQTFTGILLGNLNRDETVETSRVYRIDQVKAVNAELLELEEQDKLEEERNASRRSKRTIRIRRMLTRVSEFCQRQVEWVREEAAAIKELLQAMRDAAEVRATAEQQVIERYEGKIAELREYLVKTLNWPSIEANAISSEYWRREEIPDFVRIPEIDDAVWTEYRAANRQFLLRVARINRRSALEATCADLLDNRRETPGVGLLPSVEDLIDEPTVVPLWAPDGADCSPEVLETCHGFLHDVINTCEAKSRVRAIRSILATNRGVDVTTLSENPQDYPVEVYGDDFFNLATSVFSTLEGVRTYPELVRERFEECWVRSGTPPNHHRLILKLLELTGLDRTTATWNDLVALGKRFMVSSLEAGQEVWYGSEPRSVEDLFRFIARGNPLTAELRPIQGDEIKIRFLSLDEVRKRTYVVSRD